MGIKGTKRTEAADHEQAAVVTLLSALGEIRSRAQFGGYGIFDAGRMFALVTSDGVLHLKADETNASRYPPSTRFGKMPYYRVPDEVRQDPAQLQRWAQESIAIVRRAK